MIACAADRTLGAPLFTSTGDVKALVDQLNASVDNLNIDITQSWFPTVKTVPSANDYVNAWIRWRDQAYAFIKDYRSQTFYLAWNWYDMAAAKLNELAEWRRSYEQVAQRGATGPAPKLPAGATPVDLEWYIKAGAIFLGLGATAWVGFKIYTASKVKQAVLAGRRRR